MAYFNHAFRKVFLGTANVTTDPTPPAFSADVVAGTGYIDDTGVSTAALSQPGVAPGYFGVFDARTFLSLNPAAAVNTCCPFIIASSPLMNNDKIGPYAGGYRESNKSKMINPRYVRQFYYVNPCIAQQSIVSVGTTPGVTDAGNYDDACEALADDFLNVDQFQGGTNCNNCCKEFLCGETYYLRIDVKGSPALRWLNHQAYQTVSAYTGCCSGPSPVAVDSTTVFLQWAQQVSTNPYFVDQQGNQLIRSVVFSEQPQVSTFDSVAYSVWYPNGTTSVQEWDCVNEEYTTTTVEEGQWFQYYPTGTTHLDGACAGMRLIGAYVDTHFGNCTFQVTDFFEKEPVKILASEVDYTGDPCVFTGLCVYTECYGRQAMGFGEQVLRDLILSQSYLQNYVGSGMDFRIREITQGYNIIDSVNRRALYGRYYILHSVPRFNNPSGVFDNDQYMLEVIVNAQITQFEATMAFLLNQNCSDCVSLEVEPCNYCCTVPDTTILVP